MPNLEVTNEVLDAPASIPYDKTDEELRTMKAMLMATLDS
jgi:ornithine carbamoyltransferase